MLFASDFRSRRYQVSRTKMQSLGRAIQQPHSSFDSADVGSIIKQCCMRSLTFGETSANVKQIFDHSDYQSVGRALQAIITDPAPGYNSTAYKLCVYYVLVDLFENNHSQDKSASRSFLIKRLADLRAKQYGCIPQQYFISYLLMNGAKDMEQKGPPDIINSMNWNDKEALIKEVVRKLENLKPVIYASPQPPHRSLVLTYFLWFLSGMCGLPLHLLYLGDDLRATVWMATNGGCSGIGWLIDAYAIPGWVEENNHDRRHPGLAYIRARNEMSKLTRFLTASAVAVWLALHRYRTTEHIWIVPLSIASVVIVVVGYIGNRKGSSVHCLVAAYIAFVISRLVSGDFPIELGLVITLLSSALAFEIFSIQWYWYDDNEGFTWRRIKILMILSVIFLGVYFWSSSGQYLSEPWWVDSWTLIKAYKTLGKKLTTRRGHNWNA